MRAPAPSSARAGRAGNTVGDGSKEARDHKMSVELTVASTNFMGDSYTFLDCPGSVEFAHDMRAVLPAIDVAVVVCEMDEKKVPQLQLICVSSRSKKSAAAFPEQNRQGRRRYSRRAHDLLQAASRTKLVLRQIPAFSGEIISGFVDLALERAFVYKEHAPSEVVPLEGDVADREKTARFSMLETLADHDDELMEQLLEDIQPPRDKVFDDLSKELRDGLVCPVLIGAARRTNGVLRLMKALRHETPGVAETARRLGVNGGQRCRRLCDQDAAHGARRQDVDRPRAQWPGRRQHDVRHAASAKPAASPACSSFSARAPKSADPRRPAKQWLSASSITPRPATRSPPASRRTRRWPRSALSAGARDRGCRQGTQGRREARPGAERLLEEDPSITIVHNAEAHEVVLWGQGEMHLRVATERLADRYGVAIASRKPTVGYRETIKKGIVQRGRHKKQSGGHGQYGDVVLDIKPLPRGSGFTFTEEIKGGVVPRNYIPSVEEGVIDALKHGPLGFPVVDVTAKLIDGSYHTVDSSDMAFQLAGRLAIHDGLPQCQPVLLEPIYQVEIVCPSEATAKMNALMSGRRGQILGFDTREGWDGWDVVRLQMPEAEIGDLIVEVRSATAGVGSFTFKFDHMAAALRAHRRSDCGGQKGRGSLIADEFNAIGARSLPSAKDACVLAASH